MVYRKVNPWYTEETYGIPAGKPWYTGVDRKSDLRAYGSSGKHNRFLIIDNRFVPKAVFGDLDSCAGRH